MQWSAASLACNACHGNAPTTGKHTVHTGVPLSLGCVDCHTGFDGGAETGGLLDHPTGTGNDGQVMADRAEALDTEVAVSDEDYNGGSVNTYTHAGNTWRANVWCHNPSPAGAKSADWDGADNAACTFCHDAAPGTGSHGGHDSGTSATFGLTDFDTNSCDVCHVAIVATNYDHIADNGADGNVKFGGSVITGVGAGNNQYDTGKDTLLPASDFGDCNTNDCHNDGTGAAPYSNTDGYAWGTAEADCSTCHNNPNSVTETGNEGARHTTHVGSSVSGGIGCGNCHALQTASTHINATTNIGGTSSVTYNDPDCTNDCHTTDATDGHWTGRG